MVRNICLEEISSYPKLLDSLNKKSLNKESTLYLYQNEVYKILDANLRSTRERIILESLKQNLIEVVKINDLLYDNGYFVGYTMPLLKDLTIKELFGQLSFPKKCKIIYDMSKFFLDLYSKGFVYIDFHCSNIVLQKSNILFLDRDGMILKKDLREGNMIWIINFFWSVVISLLYDEDYSLSINALATLELLGLKSPKYDFSFFEEENIMNILKILESKKDLYSQESKDSIRRILKPSIESRFT